jgi:hypothetical protein
MGHTGTVYNRLAVVHAPCHLLSNHLVMCSVLAACVLRRLVEQGGLTYEVAFLVTAPGTAEPQQLQPLQGVKLHLCNEQDEFDADFRGLAKASPLGDCCGPAQSSPVTTRPPVALQARTGMLTGSGCHCISQSSSRLLTIQCAWHQHLTMSAALCLDVCSFAC